MRDSFCQFCDWNRENFICCVLNPSFWNNPVQDGFYEFAIWPHKLFCHVWVPEDGEPECMLCTKSKYLGMGKETCFSCLLNLEYYMVMTLPSMRWVSEFWVWFKMNFIGSINASHKQESKSLSNSGDF